MNQSRLMLLLAAAGLIGALLLADKLDEKRTALHESLEVNYATFAKKRDFILRTVKAGPALESALTDLEASESHIIPQSDTSLAFAKLQARVQDLSQSSGMRVYSIRQLPPVAHKGYISLPLFIDMRGNITTFSELLRTIGEADDFIAIDSINVTSSQQGTLRVRVQLSGLMKS